MTMMPPTVTLVVRSSPLLDELARNVRTKVNQNRPYRDGWKAARSSQARNANPYPLNATAARADWFKGYDNYFLESSSEIPSDH
jgi:hypothetical protein